jgi:hypothetical protein
MRVRFGLLVLLLAATATSVGAQTTPKPAPGCGGVSTTDPAGDQTGLTVSPGDNYDLRSMFFLTEGNKVTANLGIANLSKTVPTGATDVSWYVQWTAGDATPFVKAGVDTKGNVTFAYGTLANGIFSEEGETSGKFYEGADGVISIVIPGNTITGKKIEGPSAGSYSAQNVPMVGGRLEQADAAPDSGTGKDYNAVPCAEPPTQAAPPLAITLTTKSASRKKAKKSVAVKLTATEAVTGLSAALVKGSKTYAKGKLATVDGAATLKLKVKHKLKTGSYSLKLQGTDGAGQLRRATFRFKVKR